jgi:integrase
VDRPPFTKRAVRVFGSLVTDSFVPVCGRCGVELGLTPTGRSRRARYSGTADHHITPHIGGVRLQDLGAVRIAGLYADLERNGVPARTRELVHAVLRRALKRAVSWKLKGFNPAAEVEKPKVARRDIPVITPDQAAALLDAAAGHRLEALFVLAVASGMRQGELFGLRWQDVHMGPSRSTSATRSKNSTEGSG